MYASIVSKQKTPAELELDKQLLAHQELRHHRRSLIFIQKRNDSADTETNSFRKRASAHKSARKSNASDLRNQLKRKSASHGQHSGGWAGWLGFGGTGDATKNPMGTGKRLCNHIAY